MISGATYYTFVDSGALTLSHVDINDGDELGLQLTGTSVISMSSSTFDWAGSSATTNTYITVVNPLTSNATFYGLTFNNSRPNTKNYNITVSGANSGLSWNLQNWDGVLGGQGNTNYGVAKSTQVVWGSTATPCAAMTSVQSGGWSDPNTWNLGVIPSSCTPVTVSGGNTVTVDDTDDIGSTTTLNGTLAFSRTESSLLTMVGGNMTVNSGGTLDMGQASQPNPLRRQRHLDPLQRNDRGQVRPDRQQRRQLPGVRRGQNTVDMGNRLSFGDECAGRNLRAQLVRRRYGHRRHGDSDDYRRRRQRPHRVAQSHAHSFNAVRGGRPHAQRASALLRNRRGGHVRPRQYGLHR